jgi:hypothetical protein
VEAKSSLRLLALKRPLSPDQQYRYRLRAVWTGSDGRTMDQTQEVVFPPVQTWRFAFPRGKRFRFRRLDREIEAGVVHPGLVYFDVEISLQESSRLNQRQGRESLPAKGRSVLFWPAPV